MKLNLDLIQVGQGVLRSHISVDNGSMFAYSEYGCGLYGESEIDWPKTSVMVPKLMGVMAASQDGFEDSDYEHREPGPPSAPNTLLKLSLLHLTKELIHASSRDPGISSTYKRGSDGDERTGTGLK